MAWSLSTVDWRWHVLRKGATMVAINNLVHTLQELEFTPFNRDGRTFFDARGCTFELCTSPDEPLVLTIALPNIFALEDDHATIAAQRAANTITRDMQAVKCMLCERSVWLASDTRLPKKINQKDLHDIVTWNVDKLIEGRDCFVEQFFREVQVDIPEHQNRQMIMRVFNTWKEKFFSPKGKEANTENDIRHLSELSVLPPPAVQSDRDVLH
jgi:hypothetical protein